MPPGEHTQSGQAVRPEPHFVAQPLAFIIDCHPHFRDGLAQRSGPRYCWCVLVGITGCAVLAAWRMGGAAPAAEAVPRHGDNP